MRVRIAQFVHATNDVVDEAFLRGLPKSKRLKRTASKAWPMRSPARKSSTSTIPPSRRSSRESGVRDQGRALKWIQFTTVGIDVGT